MHKASKGREKRNKTLCRGTIALASKRKDKNATGPTVLSEWNYHEKQAYEKLWDKAKKKEHRIEVAGD